jgi:ribosome biogenesis GTPase
MTATHDTHSRQHHPASGTTRTDPPSDPPTARVVAQHRGRYLVADPHDPRADARSAVLAGRLRRDPSPDAHPVVGDHVLVAVSRGQGATDGTTRIGAVLPRRSLLRRGAADGSSRAQPLAANVDVAFVVVPLDRAPNPRRIEREVTLVWESGARPVLVLTKADLCVDPIGAAAVAGAAAPGVELVAVSVTDGSGLDSLAAFLAPGATVVLIGASGAGKSTLANHLLGAERLRTGDLRGDGAGRHTTTHRELFALPGGAFLVDTPGLRALALTADEAHDAGSALRHTFADVDTLSSECRFQDCGHRSEPGCALLAAVASGRLAAGRLESWRSLEAELASAARRREVAGRLEAKAAGRRGARALRARVAEKRGSGG